MSSSGESDNENIPDVEICQNLCEQFAQITGTDTACAQFYLQDRSWNLEKSLNDFFEDKSKKSEVLVLDGSPQGIAAAATAVIAGTALSWRSSNSSSQPKSTEKCEQNVDTSVSSSELRFITWNIDGLNEKNLKLRTRAVYKRILSEQADVIFLQEIIPETAEYLEKHLPDYKCIFANEVGYFCGTLLKRNIKYEKHSIIDFPNTRMMRNVLKVNATVGDIPLCLMNTHLESTATSEMERKHQLQIAFQNILSTPSIRTVLFAGDLNLRDKELEKIGGLPSGVEDMWIVCGSRKECSYTWDMTRNDNLIYDGKFKPRCRFDRVFIRGASPAKLSPKFFGLIGLERLLPHRCFPSDHWGILCHFSLQQ